LERVLALAKERAPEVAVARAELEASRSVAVGARVSPLQNPYLEVIAERGGRGVTRDVSVTAQLHTPIEFAGQRGRRIAEAQSFVEWNAASFELTKAQISGAVVQSYGECVTLSARYETLAELLASAQTEAAVLGARRDAGDATERDAQLAELERARIAVQLDETRASLGAALNELARLTGRQFGAPRTEHLFPRVDAKVLPGSWAPKAPVVLGAEAEARYYTRVDERLHRERLPPISIILQGGRGDFGETRLGAGLAWSLPTFRYNQGERARAQADAQRARSTASAMKSSIAQRLAAIAQEGMLLRAATERLDREAIPAAELATESATRMQRAGKTDLLSVVVARRDLYVLRLRRHELALRAWELLGEWVELTGNMPR
jgi:cobalt-zinc-cadmium efflux system outer membrane protein